MGSAQKPESRRIGLPGLIGAILSILLLWWAVHDLSLSELIENSRSVRLLPFAVAIGLATLSFPLRTVRWRYLLQPDGEMLPIAPMWHATAIGFAANNLLPARAGEVARVYAAGKLTSASYSASLASVAIERVLDALVMLALMAVALAFADFTADIDVAGVSLITAAKTMAAVFFSLLAIATVAAHKPAMALGFVEKATARLLPRNLGESANRVARGLLEGLDSLSDPARFIKVLFWSFAVWISNGMSFWFGFVAFGIDVPISGAFILQMVIAFGVSVPQAPGYVGVFEAAIRATLLLYAVEPALSVAYAMLYHVAGFIPITLLGLYSLSRAHLHLRDLRAVGEGGGDGR